MSRLRIDLTLTSKKRVISEIEYPVSAHGERQLMFADPAPFAATMKALEADDYRPEIDFTQDERNWLRARDFVVDGTDVADGAYRAYFSGTLREKIGAELFSCLLPTPEMVGIYDQCRRDAASSRVDIELHLHADTPVLGGLPWELVFDPRNADFVVGGGRGTLARFLDFPEEPPTFREIDELRLLLVSPRPRDLDDLGALEQAAISRLEAPTSGMCRRIRIVLQTTRIEEAERYLRDNTGASAPHVVHFDGHGGFGRMCPRCRNVSAPGILTSPCGQPLQDITPQGYLACEGPDGRVQYVSAKRFADMIGTAAVEPGANIQLAVISACRSGAARGGRTVFNGVAQKLVERRIPAVVAMQFPVEAGAATEFAETFYRRLLCGATLASAVAAAQTTLDREGDQWFRPVLYLRSKDNPEGRLFPAPEPQDGKDRRDPGDHPDVLRALERSRNALETVFEQLDALTAYKKVHDELDQMQPIFRLIQEAATQLQTDSGAWVDISATLTSFPPRIRALTEVLRRGAIKRRDVDNVKRVIAQCAALRAAVDSVDTAAVGSSVDTLRVLMNVLPADFNEQLVDSAEAVRLPLLQDALQQLQQAMVATNAAPARIDLVENAIVELRTEHARLVILVSEHAGWQMADNTLTMLESQGADAYAAMLKPSWDMALAGVRQYFVDRPEQWALALSHEAATVEYGIGLLTRGEPRPNIAPFVSRGRLRFSEVDEALLAECDQLELMRAAMRDLLDSLDGSTAGEV